MFPLIETAYAMAPGAGGGDGGSLLGGFIPIILVFAIFFFLVIRPQQKRSKEHRKLVETIKKGDEVLTDGGILGTIQKVGEGVVTLEIAPKVSIRIHRSRIAEMVKETHRKDTAAVEDQSAKKTGDGDGKTSA